MVERKHFIPQNYCRILLGSRKPIKGQALRNLHSIRPGTLGALGGSKVSRALKMHGLYAEFVVAESISPYAQQGSRLPRNPHPLQRSDHGLKFDRSNLDTRRLNGDLDSFLVRQTSNHPTSVAQCSQLVHLELVKSLCLLFPLSHKTYLPLKAFQASGQSSIFRDLQRL